MGFTEYPINTLFKHRRMNLVWKVTNREYAECVDTGGGWLLGDRYTNKHYVWSTLDWHIIEPFKEYYRLCQ